MAGERRKFRSFAVVLVVLAVLAFSLAAGAGCKAKGDDWDDFVGSWIGTGATVYDFTLTIYDNGHISYYIDFLDGSSSYWTDEVPDWNGDSFRLHNVDAEGDWSDFTVSFSSGRVGSWSIVGTYWSPTGGTLYR